MRSLTDHGRRLRGFSLIELLVVTAIVAVLMGTLLPAIQRARESARRTQCQNNLAQLGIAMHTYESSHDCLPPGVVNVTGPIRNLEEGYHMSWVPQILPMIDQVGLYQTIRFEESAYSASNAVPRSSILRTMLCPSDSSNVVTSENGSTQIAFTNYAACFGGEDVPIDTENSGLLFLNSRITFAQIRDGASNTILAGEKTIVAGTSDLGWLSGTRSTLRNTGVRINQGWDQPSVKGGAGGLQAPSETSTSGFSSHHGDLSNFLFADGAVKLLSRSVGLEMYSRLGQREDMQFTGALK